MFVLKILVLMINFLVYKCQILGYYPIDEYQLPPASGDFSMSEIPQTKQSVFSFGSCRIVINPVCPDPDINFFLYSKSHPEMPEVIRIGSDPFVSNLTQSAFNPKFATKIIVHGYNSDMYLNALIEIRKEYLKSDRDINVFTVDWGPLAQGPCYPGAVWNAKHVGNCAALLVERIRELGSEDLHVIGFSLGAHVTNYLANALRPYKLPRITGLDPALPGFITWIADDKLDKTDAQFVDILHTNAFMQGKVEETGHVDFYINGGVIQPGCWAENRFFACNHHRAPLYFAESINTEKGFWAWPCPSYFEYLLGRCPPVDPQIIMGEHINRSQGGVYLVITESVAPYAVGKYNGPTIEILLKSELNRKVIWKKYHRQVINMMDEDVWFDYINRNQSIKNEIKQEFINEIFV